jgi:hypothetical protein
MSFDIFLQAFNRGDPAVRDFGVFEGLLAPHLTRPSEDRLYVVRVPDGGEAEVFASNDDDEPFTGCMLALRGLTPGLSESIYRLAKSLDLVIMPAYDGPWLLVSSDQRAHLPQAEEGEFDTEIVTSASDLDQFLRRGANEWSKYRDQIAGDV